MFSKTTPQTKPATAEEHPRYREAADKLNELRETFRRMESEIEAARLSRSEIPAQSTRLEDDARAYLSGAGTAVLDPPATLEAIDEMLHRRGILKEAIRLQGQHVDAVHGEIGREIATAARPEYEAIVRRMAEALAALSAVAEEESAFRERLDDQRITFSGIIPPVPLQWARLSVYASRVNCWFDEVERDYGVRSKIERQREP